MTTEAERVARAACIGWAADPPCPRHGIMHGCKLGAGHQAGRGGCHTCDCGATIRTRDLPIERNYSVKARTYAPVGT